MITHRPNPTNSGGMDCTCGVYCGRDLASWRSHRDDLLILHPGADTLERRMSDLERLQQTVRAVGQAYANVFEKGAKAVQSFADALAADLRRSNTAGLSRARAEQRLYLNRPVITPPSVAEMMKRAGEP